MGPIKRALDTRERRAEISKIRQHVAQRGDIELDQMMRLVRHIVWDMGLRGSEMGTLEDAGRCLDEVRKEPQVRAAMEMLACVAEAALKLRGRMRPD